MQKERESRRRGIAPASVDVRVDLPSGISSCASGTVCKWGDYVADGGGKLTAQAQEKAPAGTGAMARDAARCHSCGFPGLRGAALSGLGQVEDGLSVSDMRNE